MVVLQRLTGRTPCACSPCNLPRRRRLYGASSKPGRLDRGEFLALQRRRELVERAENLGIGRALLHRVEPALHVGEALEAATDQLAAGENAEAEIIGDGELVGDQVFAIGPEQL